MKLAIVSKPFEGYMSPAKGGGGGGGGCCCCCCIVILVC